MRDCLRIARELIEEAEGFSGVEYICPAGYRTIGFGRNLQTNPLSSEEEAKCFKVSGGLSVSKNIAREWLEAEIYKIFKKCKNEEWFKYLDAVRGAVVIDIIYNIGFKKWESFKNCRSALAEANFGIASEELGKGSGEGGKSKYLLQVKTRGERNIKMLKDGQMPYFKP